MVTYAREPVQVYLREDQLQILESLAGQRGVSVADVIREQVETLISDVPLASSADDTDDDSIYDLIGIIASGTTDTGDDHDRHIVEMLEEENRSWQGKSS